MEKEQVVTVHEDEGIRTGIVVSDGYKYVGVIWPDSSGIRIHKINSLTCRITPIDYPTAKAKTILRRCGRHFGITKAAKRSLRA